MKIKTIIILILLFSFNNIYSQKRPEGKLKKDFLKAVSSYQKKDFNTALIQIIEILEKDNSYSDFWILKADIHNDLKQIDEAVEAYQKSYDLDTENYKSSIYYIGNMFFENELYSKSIPYFKKYLSFNTNKHFENRESNLKIPIATFRDSLIKNSAPLIITNIGENINSAGYEYINALSLDEELIYFTRKGVEAYSNESFFKSISTKDNLGNRIWQEAKEIGEPISTAGNEGAMCVSPDGITIILTCCSRRDSYGSCDLYFSNKEGDSWTEPGNLGPQINTNSWESQPSFAADGKTLYFVSNRSGGFGGSDIYYSKLNDDGSWTKPENLGKEINTSKDEMSPFIHPDGKTLYFSSNGHVGMGNADLFVTEKISNNQWKKPKNLGYPINTKADEINIILNAAGDFAYISSNRDDTFGNTDIYRINLPQNIRPDFVAYIKGIVRDKNSKNPLLAKFEIIDLQSDSVVISSWSDKKNGEFIFSLPTNKSYALNVSCPNYMFYSHNFTYDAGVEVKNDTMLVEMIPIIEGEKTTLRNVFFDHNKYELLSDSRAELNKLVKFLTQNQQISIGIQGHTDNVGDEKYNQILSENRAKAVYQYLINSGIEAKRLSYKGFGESAPIETNDTEEGRALNRRTEFVIVDTK